MMAEKRDNSGILGLNDRKEKDSHPDHKGSCTINGVEYWVSGWNKENGYGPFISLSFTPKDAKPSHRKDTVPVQRQAPASTRPKFDNFDDDIPF
jgi:hypothetical protein